MNGPPTATTVLKGYYDAVQRRDMRAARVYLADDMIFVGLFETYSNADAYIATFTQLMQIVARLDVRALFGDEKNAAIFMDMVTEGPVNATTLVAEWHQVRNGKIVRVQSAFDGRPFAAMFTSPQDRAADEAAIKNLKETFAKALLSGDAALRASIWTEEGTLVPPQGGFYQGRAALARHFATESPSITPESRVKFSNFRFRFIGQDTAFVDADVGLENVFGRDGKVAPLVQFAVAFVAVRREQSWFIQDERAYLSAPRGA